MALAWNAGWVNALRGSNPLSSAREVPDQFWSGTFSLPRSAAEPRYCRRMLPSTTGRLIAGGTGLALSAFVDAPLKKWMPRNRTSSYAIGLMVAAAVYPVARQGRTRLRHTVDVSIPTREWSAVAATFAVFVGALILPSRSARRLVAASWAIHPIFDLLHERGPDSRLPDWYPAICAGYDLGVAGLLTVETRNFV